MSLRVVGYKDGKRIVVDEGRSHAVRQGYGGTSIGFWTGTVVKPQPAKARLPRQPLGRKDRAFCGLPVRFSDEPCARLPGHRDSHKSAEALARHAARRRAA